MNGEEKNLIRKKTLYLVSTPLGNMADVSDRVRKTLAEVDFIAAEDTRVAGKLLSMLGISRPLVSYYEQNKAEAGERIAARLEAGESCALVTDAGTPAISDPGEDLVRLCRRRGISVTAVPGPCAAVTALSVSGLPTRRFTFIGFLPAEGKPRAETLDEIKRLPHTLVIYEAPHRLLRTLGELLGALGDREVSVCRELTKLNEEVTLTTLGGALAMYGDDRQPRGEYALVIAGKNANDDDFWRPMTVGEHVAFYENGGMNRRDAMKAAAADRGISKSAVYKELLGG